MKESLKDKTANNSPSTEAPYMTGTTGVTENPNAPKTKELHVYDPPKHSTKHF